MVTRSEFNLHIMRRFGVVLLTCLISFLSVRSSSAAEQVKVTSSRFGFSRKFANNSWCPVYTTVENKSAAPVNVGVVLSVDLPSISGKKCDYLRRVNVSARSTRVVTNYVYTDAPRYELSSKIKESKSELFFSNGKKREIVSCRGRVAFTSSLVDIRNGRQMDKYKGSAVPMHPDSGLVLFASEVGGARCVDEAYKYFGLPYVFGEHDSDSSVISSQDTPFSMAFCKAMLPYNGSYNSGSTDAVRMRVSDIPRSTAAYKSVTAVFLANIARKDAAMSLDPAQRDALLGWVRNGGCLVVMPSYDMASYRDPFWSALLPARLVGTRLVDDEDGPFEKRYGGKIEFDPAVPPVMVEAVAGEGEVILEKDGNVLLSRKSVGCGEVWFMALPAGMFEKWSGAGVMTNEMFGEPLSSVPGASSQVPGAAGTLLQSMVGIPAPSRGLIAALLIGFLVLSTIALTVTHIMKRSEWGWPLVIVLSIAGVLVAFFIGSSTKKSVGFVKGELGVTQLANNSGEGLSSSFVALYSPVSIECDLKWKKRFSLATALGAEGMSRGGGKFLTSLTIAQGEASTFPNMNLKSGEMVCAHVVAPGKFGDGVQFEFGYGAKGYTGRVVNKTGGDLHSCMVKINRRAVNIGDIPAGAEKDLASCEMIWGDTREALMGGELERVRHYLFAQALRIPKKSYSGNETRYEWPVAFYGWADREAALLSLGEDEPQKKSLNLIAVEADSVASKGSVFVPAGSCGLRMLRGGMRNAYGDPLIQRWRDDDTPARRGNAKRKNVNTPSGMPQVQKRKAPELSEIFRPTGWKDGEGPTRVRVGFSLPQGLEKIRAEKIALVFEADLQGLAGQIRIRKAGEDQFQTFEKFPVGRVVLDKEIREIKKYLGAGGELPEFELRISPPMGVGVGQGRTRWRIKKFDVKIWGRTAE